MKYRIEKRGDEVVISFEDFGGNPQAMIDAIGRCRSNAWSCATGECMKIAKMETCTGEGALAVRLKPLADLDLDVAGLGECLKYQLPREFKA